VLWGAAAIQRQLDDSTQCRWCDPGGFDRWVRDELLWSDNGAAGTASDVAMWATMVGSAAAVGWQASREGDRREVIEDVLLVAASLAVTDGLTRIVQSGTDRLRPYAWASGGPQGERELRAFFSGHVSRAFAAAAAATQVSRLRGRRGTAWVAAATFTAAAATAWLRSRRISTGRRTPSAVPSPVLLGGRSRPCRSARRRAEPGRGSPAPGGIASCSRLPGGLGGRVRASAPRPLRRP
jgi:hypothetical protein